MKRWFIAALVLSACGVAQGAQTVGKPAAAEARLVEQLLGSVHGLDASRNPEIAQLIEAIRRDPTPYIPLLGARIQPGTIANGDEESVRQAQIAAGLLVRACGEAGRVLAARHFDALHTQSLQIGMRLARPAAKDEKARRADIVEAQRGDRMISVARAIVAEFAAARDARLRDGLVARFPADDYITQLASLDYFEKAAPQDPKVQALIRAQYESKKSGFYRSERMRALLEPGKPGVRQP
jgi:hypothetical protein